MTSAGIMRYARDKLNEAIDRSEREHETSEYLQDLLEEIARKSQGVFIWVRLVIDDLARWIEHGDPLNLLRERLYKLPRDLEPLYDSIFAQIKAQGYLEDALLFLSFLQAKVRAVTLLDLSLMADTPTGQYLAMDETDRQQRIREARARVQSRCRNLVEIFEIDTSDQKACATLPSPKFVNRNPGVKAIHLTVAQYLYSHELICNECFELYPREFQLDEQKAKRCRRLHEREMAKYLRLLETDDSWWPPPFECNPFAGNTYTSWLRN